jgi:hypothetical protein
MVLWYMFLCVYDEVTNVPCVSLLSHDISIRQSNSVQTDLCISSSTLATAVVMSREERMPGNKFSSFLYATGERGGAVIEVLRYKSEGRRIDSRWCH